MGQLLGMANNLALSSNLKTGEKKVVKTMIRTLRQGLDYSRQYSAPESRSPSPTPTPAPKRRNVSQAKSMPKPKRRKQPKAEPLKNLQDVKAKEAAERKATSKKAARSHSESPLTEDPDGPGPRTRSRTKKAKR